MTQEGNRLAGLVRHADKQSLVSVPRWHLETRRSFSYGPKRTQKLWWSEVMLRVLMRKCLYNLAERQKKQIEVQLCDRLSFLRFVRLREIAPGNRMLLLYREKLRQTDRARERFDAFDQQLLVQGSIVKEGSNHGSDEGCGAEAAE